MKILFIIFTFFIGIESFAGKLIRILPDAEFITSDTTVIPQILNLPLASKIGKPVDSLISILPQNYNYIGIIPARTGYAKGVFISYGLEESNICHVEIYWATIQYLPVPNYTPVITWDLSLAKKETISFIKVIKNNVICVYGCNNPRYQ